MPKKFTDLAELTALDTTDVMAVVDTSANASKKLTVQTLLNYLLPSGITAGYAGNTAPQGWLLCDGSPVSRTTYASLFSAIGTAHGTGDGTTTFNLPDYRGRARVGLDAGQTEFNTIGKKGGAKTHTLTVAEMPAHTHQDPTTNGIAGSGYETAIQSSTSWDYGGAAPTSSTGGGGAHNNLQPYITENVIIKV